MRSEDVRKFSTIKRESLWWRADIRREDLQWSKKHLQHYLDARQMFGEVPASFCLTDGSPARTWDERLVFVEGEIAPRVHIRIGERYDYRREYEKAKLEKDPYLSPHGL